MAFFTPMTFVAAPSCAALVSDGPVKHCTTSWKVCASVSTNVVKGLQQAVPLIIHGCLFHLTSFSSLSGSDLQ